MDVTSASFLLEDKAHVSSSSCLFLQGHHVGETQSDYSVGQCQGQDLNLSFLTQSRVTAKRDRVEQGNSLGCLEAHSCQGGMLEMIRQLDPVQVQCRPGDVGQSP